ncbi:MAG: glycosyltransferase family 4 protein [Bacteroidales bacterium]|nr:glycosyltransferase family 4 protein [Bacteroidales bacterium]
MKQILYLYREIMPYNIAVLEEITKQGFGITVIHDTKKKLTPYVPPAIENVTFDSNEKYSKKQLAELALSLNPGMVYVSDRTNAKYNYVCILLRKRKNIPVISGCDSQWKGGRQWFNVFTSWFRHKRFFSHMLVAGMRQFEYAKKLGFGNEKILWPLYSANNEVFMNIAIKEERFKHPRKFLFAGRFAKVKGLDILLEAWNSIIDKRGATLTLVGNGPLKNKFNYPKDVIIHNFMNQKELGELAACSSCFILPSVFEPWALVIHEFAAAGMPLIVTGVCGATPHFVINNYNGLVINPNSVDELKSAIEKIIAMPDQQLFDFALRSRELSMSINPRMVAHAITSVLN